MTVSLILLAAIVLTGVFLRLHEERYRRREASRKAAEETPAEETPAQPEATDDEACCGMHITCERDSLLAAVSPDIVYYDDEELDRFAGRDAESYDDAEIDEIRDVLLTMQPDDIAGWARSLQLRRIALPTAVRDELLMIVAEERANRSRADHA